MSILMLWWCWTGEVSWQEVKGDDKSVIWTLATIIVMVDLDWIKVAALGREMVMSFDAHEKQEYKT